MRCLRVSATGPLTTVQDLGRPGRAALGVGPSGAADRAALRLANRLVGNPEGAAALEVTLGGLEVRAGDELVVALTGAPSPAAVDGRAVASYAVVALRAGQLLTLAAPLTGLRTYVAVRGGIDVPAVLGSRSTDVLAGIGPPALAAGDTLPVGHPPPGFPAVDVAPVAPPVGGDLVLRVVIGPRADWFAPEALRLLARTSWEVTPDSDRVGMRLSGPRLRRARAGELPSEGMVRGALQVPPSGQPTLLLADHPVTGGYPVIAVVPDRDADRAAQARPGQRLRFHPLAPASPT